MPSSLLTRIKIDLLSPNSHNALQHRRLAKRHRRASPLALCTPSAKEFVIKNYAWSINPVDWVLQDTAHITWLNYPLISGEDVASEVFEVVSNVTRFEVSDCVLGTAIGLAKNEPSGNATPC